MELRHLRYFAAVAAQGSFSGAAKQLHLTQPALSRQVRDLEDELGVQLIVRGKNNITLTASGDAFFEDAKDLLARADVAVGRIKAQSRAEKLKVGYVHSLTSGVMPRAVKRFQSGNDRVFLQLVDLTTQAMSDKASAGQLDMAILPRSLEPRFKGYQWVELQRLSPVLIVSKRNALSKSRLVNPAKLRGKMLFGLGPDKYPEYVPRLKAILKPFGVKPQLCSQSANDIAALFIEIEANAGLAVLTEGVLPMLPSTIVMRRFSPELAPLVIAAGMPALNPKLQAEKFLKILLDEISRNRTH